AEAWKIIRRRRRIQVGPIVAPARQHVVQPPPMTGMGMIHASNQAILVGLPRQSGQMLTDAYAGHVRGDGSKLAAEFGRSVRLQVKRVNLTRSAKQIDHQASFGLAEGALGEASLRMAGNLR